MDKKDKIINASAEAFVELGFHGAPITKLIKRAGVSNGTFFYYFKTKEELITAIYVAIKQDLYNAINGSMAEDLTVKKRVYLLWKSWVNWGIRNMTYFKFLEQFASSPFINNVDREQMHNDYSFIEDILNKGIKDEVLVSIDVKLMCEIIYGSIRSAILYNIKQEDKACVAENLIFDLLWKSIVNT